MDDITDGEHIGRVRLLGRYGHALPASEEVNVYPIWIQHDGLVSGIRHGGFQVKASGQPHRDDVVAVWLERCGELTNPFSIGSLCFPHK